ncbi:pseudouridylate synthase PUS7L isoform X1 [Cavia porcellus]|uniref:Pseudouridylate synthase PUS7L n=1 Tax=Cavia porcellus TaxID=10141 RepID=H0UX00_CAVPO|nr:pseudouridylate synthase 7 homolog-like protein isoform X1 [Cavia porcellus]XP_013014779.1 pseudouridylate synthase 7 homolog-like protein isoform X1 [Cavia porcellus]XP_013014780.1 pseudouridylate synthase 7 homolog-like protein isoform X1 [Cavia porcellus]XP_023423367.1 pseudouridylate synthase 7 homolog-like protein isoform X1 [Cavia porcellus]
MEEDTDYKVWFSSLCFINGHVGFHGTIKSSPSDFIVVEINEHGQLVNKTIDEPVLVSKMLPELNNFAKKPKLSLQNLPLDNKEENTLAVCSNGDQNHQSESEKKDTVDGRTCKQKEEKADVLSSFLDEKTNESLDQFACDIKEKWNSETESIEQFPEFSLGRILDKNQRASLHSAIRQKFPFLITVGKNSEIVVKPNLEFKELCRLVSEEEALDFFKYLDAKKENSKFTFKPDINKAHRKAVHHFVNKKFGNLVETKSFPEQNNNASNPNIVITVRFREKTHKHGKRSVVECQEGKIVHTAFTLRKENLEMFEAVGFLAIKLGVIPSDFSYAGLKDKKAITYQAMVVRKVTPERLKNIEKEIAKKRMNVFNIRSVSDSLRLGQLKGNHFDIIIRNLKNKVNDSANLRERIQEAIENVKTKGFVNYYGPQRFGQGRKVHTDQIGLALLKSEMVKAVKLFLTPEDLEDPVNRAKKFFLQTEDAKGTLSLMPEFKVRERALLEALHRFGMTEEGCIQAWFSFPHSMRIFYIHAYSSKIWNEAVSYRLATYGSKVVEGDLICLDEDIDEYFPNNKVHLVTEEEAAASTYAIHQVVLPVLGYNTQYPKNKVGQWYREILSRDGLQACRFKVPALKLNVPGCYRHILKHPHNLSYQLMGDLETNVKMQGFHIDETTVSLLISFDLDASCYATVCLREIMKHDI